MRQSISTKLQWLVFVPFFFMLGSSAVAQVPQISGPLVPSSAAPGSVAPTGPGLALTVHGTGFVPGSAVYWNGSPRVTTFLSSTSLTATITAEDVESPGTAWVTVVNPGVAARSNVTFFEITNPTTSVSFAKTDYGVGYLPRVIAIGDLNGDGKLDLAVNNEFSNTVGLLLGNGDGTFQAEVAYPVGSFPIEVTVGDLNRDSKLDLAVANYGSNNVSVMLGNGDGTFQAAVNYAAGASPHSVTVADFNGDGKPDLAVANYNGGNVSLLLGMGDGTFQTAVSYAVGPLPNEVKVG